MTTLRREVFTKILDAIRSEATDIVLHEGQVELAERLTESVLSLRAFKTDEETPPYNLEEADIAWTIKAGVPVTQKHVNKQKEVFELETMICAELARLPYLFEGDQPKEQDNFRRFIKEKRKAGQELKVWVDWWMSDEWRVANPPWKLTTIKVKWLEAFVKSTEKPTRPEYKRLENNDENSVPNPNKERPAILRK